MFELKEYLGCLSAKRMPESAIVRAIPFENDEDSWMGITGDSYAVDTLGKIKTSKAYRRLGGKTQVLTNNVNAHVHDRLTHTNDVVNVAVFISSVLGLNVDLCQAIASGHDIGHAPFGHLGEQFISEKTGKKFSHAKFGVIVSQYAERHGDGLNLTRQTKEGIMYHSGQVKQNMFPEAKVTAYSDKISFTLADYNDIFQRTRILDIGNYPQLKKLIELCGTKQRERLNFFIKGLCKESAEKGDVCFETSKEAILFKEIKENMYKVYNCVNMLNDYVFLENTYALLAHHKNLIDGVDPAIVLALMTDDDVFYLNKGGCINGEDFYKCSVAEIVGYLKGKEIDFENPDLDR